MFWCNTPHHFRLMKRWRQWKCLTICYIGNSANLNLFWWWWPFASQMHTVCVVGRCVHNKSSWSWAFEEAKDPSWQQLCQLSLVPGPSWDYRYKRWHHVSVSWKRNFRCVDAKLFCACKKYKGHTKRLKLDDNAGTTSPVTAGWLLMRMMASLSESWCLWMRLSWRRIRMRKG